MSELKFKLTTETKINAFGIKLFRIEATVDFKNVKKGDKGGWVESESLPNGNARVYGDAWVSGNAEVYGNAIDSGYCFAYKGNDWNVTEVPTKDGLGVLLIRDYTPPKGDKPEEFVTVDGHKYKLVEE